MGPYTCRFQGTLLWVPEHRQYESLGGPTCKGYGVPRVSRQETYIYLCTWFSFFSLLWGVCFCFCFPS